MVRRVLVDGGPTAAGAGRGFLPCCAGSFWVILLEGSEGMSSSPAPGSAGPEAGGPGFPSGGPGGPGPSESEPIGTCFCCPTGPCTAGCLSARGFSVVWSPSPSPGIPGGVTYVGNDIGEGCPAPGFPGWSISRVRGFSVVLLGPGGPSGIRGGPVLRPGGPAPPRSGGGGTAGAVVTLGAEPWFSPCAFCRSSSSPANETREKFSLNAQSLEFQHVPEKWSSSSQIFPAKCLTLSSVHSITECN